jgi:hypothetical protein
MILTGARKESRRIRAACLSTDLPDSISVPMTGLIHALLTLAIILIGIGVMIGRITMAEALRKILLAVVGLFVASALVVNAGRAWASLSAIEQGAAAAAVLFAVPLTLGTVILRSDFGKKVLASILGDWIYDRFQEGDGCCGVQMVLMILLVAMLALILG